MAKRIYGFLADAIAGETLWVDGEGEASAAPGARDEGVLFVPGEDVTVLSMPVPVRTGAQAREAAAYSVEDEIAVNVEDEHIALGIAGDDLKAPRAIHVVSREAMQGWTDWLERTPHLAGVKLVSAPSVLPAGTVLNVEGTYLAHINGRAFSLGPDMPGELAAKLIDGHTRADIAIDDALGVLATYAEQNDGWVDLRQGAYQVRSSGRLQDIRAWRTSALLAGALLLVWIGSNFLQIRALHQEADALNARIANTYRAAFPDAPPQANYVRAVSRAISERGANQIDFRDASAALYAALQTLPQAELRSIRYDQSGAGFVARIAYSAYGEDAQLKTILSESGYTANLGALRQEGTKVVGDVAFGGAAQ